MSLKSLFQLPFRKVKIFIHKILNKYPKVKLDSNIVRERHGSDYGGWVIKANSLNRNSIIYSFGVGYDITFDNSLIEKYGCQIYAYDPTDKVEEWLNNQKLSKKFNFKKMALSNKDEILKFFASKDKWHYNESKTSIQDVEIEVHTKKMGSLLIENSHKKIDLIKIDIEGSEYVVIDDLIESAIFPKQLLIEFHHFLGGENSNKRTEEYINKLKSVGYKLFNISPFYTEFSFVLE